MNALLAPSPRSRDVLRLRTAARLFGPAAVAALVGALVGGILGMHALSVHGTPAAPGSLDSTTSVAWTGSSHHEAAVAAGDSDGHEHNGATGHGMGSTVMLCVVMLAAAGLMLLALLVTGSLRPLRPAAFGPAAVGERALQWVRATGPPDAWRFSVIRC